MVLTLFRLVFQFWSQKTLVFQFWCLLQFPAFLLFGIWFSVLVRNTSGFPVLVSDVVFGFSHFVLFGFRFLFDFGGNRPFA